MNCLLLSLLLLISLVNITNVSSAPAPASPHTCYDHQFTSEKTPKFKPVDCVLIDEPPKSQTLKGQAKNGSMFTINVNCQSPNVDFCGKVKRNLELTGETISKAIILKETVVVDITFKPLAPGVIGQTSTSRFISLKGGDGVERLYPQALVKQFQFPTHPEFLPSDIQAEFSSELDFWFEDDTTPIKPTQLSFVYMTMHEFMHGLGFLSIWAIDDSRSGLLPALNAKALDASQNPPVIYNGFIASIFDRFVFELSSGKTLSDLAADLGSFAPKGTQFASLTELFINFTASTQSKVAIDLLTTATTPLTLGFLKQGLDFKTITPKKTADDPLFYLETKINPYRQGSSVSHASQDLYLKTPDFLMTFQEPQGETLTDAIKNGGSPSGSAIGPRLISVLESLGYATANNPTPEIPTIPDSPIVSSR